MSEKVVYCWVKFGRKEHMENLFNNGEVCFSAVRDFRESSENERGDSLEGAYSIENVTLIDIKCDHPTLGTFHFKPLPNSKTRLTHFNDDPYLNFSIYAVTSNVFENNFKHTIDKRMAEFGDYAVIIKDPKLFLDKIFNKLKAVGVAARGQFVDYRDYKNIEKLELTFFNKSIEFKHQEEYRIIIESEDNSKRIVGIGSIKEYAILIKSSEAIEMFWEAKKSST
ncbi:MAG: hypothetical protein V4592_01300 [Bacteroidota bacterium]